MKTWLAVITVCIMVVVSVLPSLAATNSDVRQTDQARKGEPANPI